MQMAVLMRQMIGAIIGLTALAAPTQAQLPLRSGFATTASSALSQQLAAIASSGTGRIGIAATNLDTGETFAFAGRDPFPMASTVKIAIAGAYLDGVDRGRFHLDQLYSRGRTVIRAGRLIELMLIRSDNGAADILLKEVGGTTAVNAWLARAGIRGQRMDRTIARLVLDDRSRTGKIIANLPLTPQDVAQSTSFTDDGEVNPAFIGDARDTSTPAAMVTLLAKLQQGALLSQQSTNYLFDVMTRCVTGAHRIKALLPPGTPVAHKTGTLAGVSDDVGIISLPNGHRLALAIFAKGMRSEWERDRSIAEVARLLYDRFSAMGPAPMAWGTAP
jgi:beta-lactamase class A